MLVPAHMHYPALMQTLITYIEQIESAAESAGVDLRKVARDIGYDHNISRWMNKRCSPREHQARRLIDAISQTARQQ